MSRDLIAGVAVGLIAAVVLFMMGEKYSDLKHRNQALETRLKTIEATEDLNNEVDALDTKELGTAVDDILRSDD